MQFSGTKGLTFALFFNRILEVARCSQLTDVGFTTLARVSIFFRFCVGFVWDFYFRKMSKEGDVE